MNKRKAYQELDKNLKKVLKSFWKKYPDISVSYYGSVLWGNWQCGREGFIGEDISFKLSDEQITDLIRDGQCVVKEKDIMRQKEFKE